MIDKILQDTNLLIPVKAKKPTNIAFVDFLNWH